MSSRDLTPLKHGRPVDLLVVGGGATGCGIALDAATRGVKTILIERYDYAEGTSSRSTKLVHGGVRYLEAAVRTLDRAQYRLVRDALHERGAFLRNIPHLTRRLPLVTPIYSWLQVPYLYAGLKLYDLLSGRMNIGHSTLIGRAETLRRFPMLKAEGLKASVVYYDGQFVDTRVAVTLAMDARAHGAAVANQVEAIALCHDEQGQLTGAEVRDRLTGETWTIHARTVVNATGPFADGLRRMENPEAAPILKVSSGIHIVLDGHVVPPGTGLLIPKTDDGRVLFMLPWQGHTLVGTTDTACTVSEHPEVSEADIAYLLDYMRRYFAVTVTRADVLSAWSGVRPLVFNPNAAGTAELARDHVILEDPSGLITIAGGKWTTYRLMAEQAVDRVVARLGGPRRPCRTATMPVRSAVTDVDAAAQALVETHDLDAEVAHHLVQSYGTEATAVAALAAHGWGAHLAPGHPHLEAEVLHAIRAEDAVHAGDVLIRRLTLALVDREAARAAAPRVIDIMAAELGWDTARRQAEEEDLSTRLTQAL